MNTLNTYITGALFLILVYLVLTSNNTNSVLKGLSSFNTSAIAALQGRSVGFGG